MTNRQIAGKLFISERTAEYHVEQIRNKLGFHARSQIAAWVATGREQPAPVEPESARAEAPTRGAPPGLLVDQRLRLAVIGLLAAIVISGTGLAVVSIFNAPATPSTGRSVDSVVQVDGSRGDLLGKVPTNSRGDALAMDGVSLWEISYSARTLSRINPTARSVVASYGVPVPAPPIGIAVGADSVWVTTAFGDKSLLRFDTKTQQWDQPIILSSGLDGVAYGANSVWAVDKADDLVYRVDPTTDSVTARIPVGEGPERIAAGSGAIWVANAVGGTISRIDPTSNTVTATIALRGSPSDIAIGADAVWVVSEAASLLIRIDPLTDTAVEVPFGAGPSAVVAIGSAIWVTEGVAGRVSRVDPRTYARTSTVAVDGSIDGTAADNRSIWVTRHVLADPPLPSSTVPRGGVLRVVIPAWKASELASPDPNLDALDPQIGGNTLDSNEILRCCLLRTLVSHVGRSYREGGAELRPDLAAKLPEASADGLTWTFRIRPGIHYAPPMQQSEIVTADFVRALQRDARVAGSTTFSMIQGFDAYANGKGNPSTIAGLETPDRYTLKIHLRQVAGDIPYRFALPESAPIPPSPIDPNAPFGAASGHDSGYGPFLVASGPYMIQGSPGLDFSLPPDQQHPVSGFHLSHELTLVRNPSWSSGIDALRPAYVSEMRFTIGGSEEDAAGMLDTGQADLILRGSPPPQVLPSFVEKVRSNPSLGHVNVNERDFLRAVEMNLAVPPFDDIHIRRAVNYILDKRTLLDAHGGASTGKILTHYLSDSLEDGALTAYDPYFTPGYRGSLTLARQEMSQSRYDPGHTGVCTSQECKHVLAFTIPNGDSNVLFSRLYGGFPRLGAIIADNLKEIGITLDVQSTLRLSDLIGDPAARIPLDLTLGLGSAESWMSASSSFLADFSSNSVGGSLVGATSDQLRQWGYSVTDVPNLDSRIHECMQGGERQAQCWTALDVYVMEKIVPIAPYTMETVIDVVPSRVVHYSFDQSSDEVALDQIGVRS
jgi:YVTN family beta-propeller protein